MVAPSPRNDGSSCRVYEVNRLRGFPSCPHTRDERKNLTSSVGRVIFVVVFVVFLIIARRIVSHRPSARVADVTGAASHAGERDRLSQRVVKQSVSDTLVRRNCELPSIYARALILIRKVQSANCVN